MKRFFVVLAAIALAVSCDSFRSGLKFTHYSEEASLPLVMEDSLLVKIDIDYPGGNNDNAVKDSVCSYIKNAAFGKGYEDMSVEDAGKAYIENYHAEYKTTSEETYEYLKQSDDLLDHYSPMHFQRIVTGSLFGSYYGISSYSVVAYVYDGGAHGLTGRTVINWDDNTGMTVTEEMLFTDGYEAPLSALLTEELHNAIDADSYNMLFVKDIEPNGSFMLSDDGITYFYGQYEIGPYVLGEVTVLLPWEKVNYLVRPEIRAK